MQDHNGYQRSAAPVRRHAARRWLLGIVLSGAALGAHAQAQALAGLRILPQATAEASFSGWEARGDELPQQVPMELGESIDGATLQLQPATPGGEWRVQVQYETSMVVAAEGPHLDLTDWKHCVSDWQPAQPLGGDAFVLPTPTSDQASCFPTYTAAELEAAVRAHGLVAGDPDQAERWLGLLRDHRAGVDWMSVEPGISAVRVRLERLREGQWEEVATLSFLPPMGC